MTLSSPAFVMMIGEIGQASDIAGPDPIYLTLYLSCRWDVLVMISFVSLSQISSEAKYS